MVSNLWLIFKFLNSCFVFDDLFQHFEVLSIVHSIDLGDFLFESLKLVEFFSTLAECHTTEDSSIERD